MAKFSKEESDEIGLPLDLLNRWDFVMNTLWNFFAAYATKEKAVKIENPPNEIFYQLGNGHKFRIVVHFYNSSYLCLLITISGNDVFEASISNIDYFGEKGIVRIVAEILTAAENVK